MSKLAYFKEKVEATLSPMDYMKLKKMKGDEVILVDVRNAPKHIKKEKIIVVYCWETWCNLVAKACITLIENGYECMELGGGIAS